jgi:hypothetical protein
MSNRTYRFFFGAALLVALYFEHSTMLYMLLGLVFFEALTNLRIPKLLSKARFGNNGDPDEGSLGICFKPRFGIEAERSWRLLVGTMLAMSLYVFPNGMWMFPWFMGFAILGAGVSGVCPMFLFLRWVGFR